ncbi:FMN-dependent alpha-hydroxy acid dehydrogenase [Tothia fuscella]|uniref:FMN-dependent alpha-hydroxy acid dehydrogenase n=1 Tax=Tothia fuscella TaxID=1048955 RepID=A0A9P4P0Q6_9PEZI|nr:FMN-dependent alpha-hydroxy acid dehydrogenase [Tothia fuscella]
MASHQIVESKNEKGELKKYGAFQNEIYYQGMFQNRTVEVTTDPSKLEKQAKDAMNHKAFCYIAGGAGERATMDANRLAFRQWKIIPRMLRDTTNRDLQITLFGQTYPTPLLFAPVGIQAVFHPDKETGVAKIAAELKVPYILSTAAASTIEEVAEASGDGSPRWFQLYWPQTDEITISLLQRAKKARYTALVVTLDTWALAWRPWDLDTGFLPFVKGEVGNDVGFSDPVFQRIFREKHGKDVKNDIVTAAVAWSSDVFSGKAHTWEQLKVIKENWDGPIILKGIQHVEDAKLALEAGVQGIIVSNHGGRQMDGAIGSLDVLPEIVDAVGEKLTVLFDSGVRTGADVIKALCLGAKGVLIGRPWVYGLGIAGKEGAKQVMQNILADLDQGMGLSGIGTIANCNRSMVRKVQYPGDSNSSN